MVVENVIGPFLDKVNQMHQNGLSRTITPRFEERFLPAGTVERVGGLCDAGVPDEGRDCPGVVVATVLSVLAPVVPTFVELSWFAEGAVWPSPGLFAALLATPSALSVLP